MAAHTVGLGKGSKPDKIIRDALILELNRLDVEDGQKIKKVNRIVAKLVSCAIDGKIDAIREIFDRVEGKAVQAISGEGGGAFVIQVLKFDADHTAS